MTGSTKWSLYSSNEEAWYAMLDDCAKAEKSIALEQFIFTADEFGKRLIDVCAERAAAGVKVRFLWDAAGSFTFWGSNIAKDLEQRGVELLFWKTLIPSYFKVPDYRSWFLRNHRRTLVIDGHIGYTGSISVRDSMKNWRDTNVRLEGPVAGNMQSAFDRMWLRARGNRVKPPFRMRHGLEFAYETNYPVPGRRHITRAITEAVRGAQRYIYITTPYFVPTHHLLRVILKAAKRGVDVRILIPERSDHYPALDLGARSYFSALFEAGARVFLYPGNGGNGGDIIHGKTVVVDGEWATVGSLNLDSVSLLYNFEANVITANRAFAKELESHFIRDCSVSKEVSPIEWKDRFFIEKIPEILIKLVRKFL